MVTERNFSANRFLKAWNPLQHNRCLEMNAISSMIYWRIAASLPTFLLLAVVAMIATGVQRYVTPAGGLQLPLATSLCKPVKES
jgi:hypothetical protein